LAWILLRQWASAAGVFFIAKYIAANNFLPDILCERF
jgi:hypothetical protein